MRRCSIPFVSEETNSIAMHKGIPWLFLQEYTLIVAVCTNNNNNNNKRQLRVEPRVRMINSQRN
jgi:hypothetical protein